MLCFFFNQKTAYERRISDWSSYVCSSDLVHHRIDQPLAGKLVADQHPGDEQPEDHIDDASQRVRAEAELIGLQRAFGPGVCPELRPAEPCCLDHHCRKMDQHDQRKISDGQPKAEAEAGNGGTATITCAGHTHPASLPWVHERA